MKLFRGGSLDDGPLDDGPFDDERELRVILLPFERWGFRRFSIEISLLLKMKLLCFNNFIFVRWKNYIFVIFRYSERKEKWSKWQIKWSKWQIQKLPSLNSRESRTTLFVVGTLSVLLQYLINIFGTYFCPRLIELCQEKKPARVFITIFRIEIKRVKLRNVQ